MEDEKDLDKKLAEFDQKVTPEYLLKLHKLNLAKKIQNGETGLFDEFRKIKELEKEINAPAVPAAGPTSPSSPAPAPGEEGDPPSDAEEEIGIPQRLLVKRHYTWSKEAQTAREKAAQARRPGAEGNKNAWKHGKFAKDLIEGRIKPCLSTCPFFDDCELVSDGLTKPGGVCLDKAAVIATYSAIMDAIKHRKFDDFNEVAGLTLAEIMHVTRMLLEDIMREGTTVKRERYDKNGVLQMVEYVSHPSLMALPKMIADTGLTPRELNITPKARKDDENAEETSETFGKILGRVGKMLKQADEQKQPEGPK